LRNIDEVSTLILSAGLKWSYPSRWIVCIAHIHIWGSQFWYMLPWFHLSQKICMRYSICQVMNHDVEWQNRKLLSVK
jgi:hypothetical protein